MFCFLYIFNIFFLLYPNKFLSQYFSSPCQLMLFSCSYIYYKMFVHSSKNLLFTLRPQYMNGWMTGEKWTWAKFAFLFLILFNFFFGFILSIVAVMVSCNAVNFYGNALRSNTLMLLRPSVRLYVPQNPGKNIIIIIFILRKAKEKRWEKMNMFTFDSLLNYRHLQQYYKE